MVDIISKFLLLVRFLVLKHTTFLGDAIGRAPDSPRYIHAKLCHPPLSLHFKYNVLGSSVPGNSARARACMGLE